MPHSTLVFGSLYCENPENGVLCARGRKFQGLLT